MNSVMEIGEKVLFLENGRKSWEGSNLEAPKTEIKKVLVILFTSPTCLKRREVYMKN